MNTTDMTVDPAARARLPGIPITTLDDVLSCVASDPAA